MNFVRNALWMAVLFALVFSFAIIWEVIPPIMDEFYQATNYVSPSEQSDTLYLDYLSLKTMIIQGFYVLASLLVFFMLINSFIDAQDFRTYLISAFAGLIATPVVIYVVSTFWNTFVVFGITLSEVSTTFITSFPLIMLANFIFGLLSFVFMRRGQ